jgi:hypothetical protein
MALAFAFCDMAQSIAGCGGYCEARQVRAICHHAVSVQDLEARKRDAAFAKCKSDPLGYLALLARGDREMRWE